MKKFLLVAVNAKYIHSNPAVYSLQAFVKQEQRKDVVVAEFTINQRPDDILMAIYKEKPDIIGFSCYIWNIRIITELLCELPKLLPGVPVWLGGPEVSYNPGCYLTNESCVTGVMVGEGEQTFCELLSFYGKNLPEEGLKEIRGLFLRSGFTGEREAVHMDSLPFLYQNPEQFENRILYYESSRGCPYRCSYCLSSIEKTLRFRDLSVVKEELAVFLNHRVKQVKFVDRTFNCKESHALSIWKFLLTHDNGVTNFHFEIAADCVTEEQLSLMKQMRPGLIQLEIGVQSTHPDTLCAIHRKTDLNKVKDVVTRIKSFHNINQHLDLIAGLPFEDYSSFARSFDFVSSLQPEQLQLGFLKVLHGSQLEQETDQYGISFHSTPPYEVLKTKWLSYEEVGRLKRVEEMVEMYYNSNQFFYTCRAIQSLFSSSFSFFEALADFYEENGYLVHQPARAYRYEVLLRFFQSRETKRAFSEDYLKECILFDLYLREKLKTRPSFAKNLSKDKELSEKKRKAEQTENQRHMESFSYPVWENEFERSLIKKDPPYVICFDYLDRDPLTQNAMTSQI